MLHEGQTGPARDSGGHLHTQRIYKRILVNKDCSINRENPHRKLPNSSALVVGFDGKGDFQNVIKDGLTHGYWTLSRNINTPEDFGGSGADYVSRILMEFDLDEAGITTTDKLQSAVLELNVYKSKTIAVPDTNYYFDLHRFHAGLTANIEKSARGFIGFGVGTPGIQQVGEGDHFFLPATDGSTVVVTLLGQSGTSTNSETSGTTLSCKTLSSGSYGNTTLHATAQAVELKNVINYHTKFNATSSGVTVDIIQAVPGTEGNTTITGYNLGATGARHEGFSGGESSDKFNENATWYEYNHSGTGLSGTGVGEGGGATGTRGFLATDGTTHGNNRWEFQGLGWTGSTAEHSGYYPGATGWYDYSGGVSGSNQIELYSDNIYQYGFTASQRSLKAGDTIKLDLVKAVQDSIDNYDNKLRIMIKLRDDHKYDGTNKRIFMALQSSENETDPSGIGPEQVNISKYAPALKLEYLR